MKHPPIRSRLEPHTTRVAVFALGGCGINALRHMPPIWSDTFKAYAIDSDAQSIAPMEGVEVIHLNSRETQGMSTGGEADAGRRLIHENRTAIAELCATVDLAFLVAGLGGGTGGGGARALAEIASDSGALIIGFFTLPFDFEGEARLRTAEQTLQALQPHADAILLLRNQRLLQIKQGEIDLPAAFDLVARSITQSIQATWRLLNRPGLINLDMANLRRIAMSTQGIGVLVSAQAEGPDRAQRVVGDVLDHPLFDHRATLDIAQTVIVGIAGGPDLTLAQLETIMEAIQHVLDPKARILMGTSIDPDMTGQVALTLIASESLEMPETPAPEPAKQPARGTRRKTQKAVQAKLDLDASGKGRFKGVDPTLRDGQDLDVPTFIRRQIELLNS